MWFSLFLACGGPPDAAPSEPEHAGRHEAHEGHGDHAKGHPNADHAHHRFDDAEKWAKVFDDPERDGWQKPDAVIASMAITAGMTVADIGAGTGYFNPHLAKAVGPDGHVVAIDIEPNLVEHMKQRAASDATPQVEARLTKPEASGLSEGEADRVLLVDTYHHIGDREAYFGALRGALKPGGELVIVDITKDAPFGPPPEERLTAEQVEAELKAAGWALKRTGEGLPHQYLLVFAPA